MDRNYIRSERGRMLIRSQNKENIINLRNIDSISIGKKEDCFGIIAFNGIQEAHTICGRYSSNEKAIKVLDMIQDEYQKYLYSEGGPLGFVDGYVQAFGFIPPKVFQMPQDIEVEA